MNVLKFKLKSTYKYNFRFGGGKKNQIKLNFEHHLTSIWNGIRSAVSGTWIFHKTEGNLGACKWWMVISGNYASGVLLGTIAGIRAKC